MASKLSVKSSPKPNKESVALDLYVQHQVNISQFSKNEIKNAVKHLEKTQKAIITRLNKGQDLTELSQSRLTNELGAITGQIREGYVSINKEYKNSSADFALAESGWQKEALSALSEGTVPVISLSEITKDNPLDFFEGKTFTKHLSTLKAQDSTAIKSAIINGVLLGQSNKEIAANIPGAMKLSKRDVSTLVRTGIQSNAAAVRDGYFTNNTDIISAVIWTATLDGRTTQHICAPRDGLRYTVVEKKPINHGLPWIGGPPAHFNCRSASVPVIGEQEGDRAGLDFNKETESHAKSTIRVETGKKGTITGVPNKGEHLDFSKRMGKGKTFSNKINFEDWLKKQPDWFQDNYLGPKKAALFRKGGLPLKKFSEKQGRALTLVQLKKTFPKQWKDAFAPVTKKAVAKKVKKVSVKKVIKKPVIKKVKKPVIKKSIPATTFNNEMIEKAVVAFKKGKVKEAKVLAQIEKNEALLKAAKKKSVASVSDADRLSKLRKEFPDSNRKGLSKVTSDADTDKMNELLKKGINNKQGIDSDALLDKQFKLAFSDLDDDLDFISLKNALNKSDIIGGEGIRDAADMAKAFAREWNDSSVEDIAMLFQVGISREFNLKVATMAHFNRGELIRIQKFFDSNPSADLGMRKMVRTYYNNTQKVLKSEGIKEVNLFRGMSQIDIDDIVDNLTNPIDIAAVDLGIPTFVDMEIIQQPINSWTINEGVARGFADFAADEFDKNMLFFAKVKREDIFSIPRTGAGTTNEVEVVVFGGKADVNTVIFTETEDVGEVTLKSFKKKDHNIRIGNRKFEGKSVDELKKWAKDNDFDPGF